MPPIFRMIISATEQTPDGFWLPFLAGILLVAIALALFFRRQRRDIKRMRADLAAVRGHLRDELQRLAFLAQSNPRRRALVAELADQMAPIKTDLERVLFPGHEPVDHLDWMHKLKHRKFPYSITDEEGIVLYDLVTRLGLTRGYEIATAFGYSSFYLGLAFRKNHGTLVSLDAYVEEDQQAYIYDEATARRHAEAYQAARATGEPERLPEGLRFALAGARRLDLEATIRYEIGFSPMDVPAVLSGANLDFAFIDGSHFGEAPCADVEAVLPHLDTRRCVIVFHDTQCEAVAKAVFHAAEKIGGDIHALNTRNRLVLVSRGVDSSMIDECKSIISREYH